jgi:hypothetical protein
MEGNYLFSKLQLSILLFFDRHDGGILPHMSDSTNIGIDDKPQSPRKLNTGSYKNGKKESDFQNISEHKKNIYQMYLLDLGVLSYPKDRKYIDLMF